MNRRVSTLKWLRKNASLLDSTRAKKKKWHITLSNVVQNWPTEKAWSNVSTGVSEAQLQLQKWNVFPESLTRSPTKHFTPDSENPKRVSLICDRLLQVKVGELSWDLIQNQCKVRQVSGEGRDNSDSYSNTGNIASYSPKQTQPQKYEFSAV